MDSYQIRRARRLRAVFVLVFLGILVHNCSQQAPAQTPSTGAAVAAGSARDVRSLHFLLHTDLSDVEGKDLLDQLETMLRQASTYWGRPMRGTIECYVIRKYDNFPLNVMDSRGIEGIKNAEGVTLMAPAACSKCNLNKSVVYANTRPEVVLHEAVHAYCYQTFGRIGPIWYSEGMAEIGHYWKEGEPAVQVGEREIKFLRENPPVSLAAILSNSQVTGDSWQNYALRWSLCHFLVRNPNYSSQFQLLGRGFLTGKEKNFDQAFGLKSRELWFEYLLFLRNIDRGYRVDLCAWDWKKKFACLSPSKTATATIRAGRGWQPTGLTIAPEMRYHYTATGTWRVANDIETLDANGDEQGKGRLVGALMNDYQLGEEFDLCDHGLLQSPTGGDLYLRCRCDWKNMADGSGQIAISFEDNVNSVRKGNVPVSASVKSKSKKTD